VYKVLLTREYHVHMSPDTHINSTYVNKESCMRGIWD